MHTFGNLRDIEMFRSSEKISELVPVSISDTSMKTKIAQSLKRELAAQSSLDGILVLKVFPEFDFGNK